MKRKFSKMLGVAVTLAMLSSLIIAPMASAITQPTVTIATGEATISRADPDYTIRFQTGKQLKGGSAVTALAGAWILPDIGDTMTFTAATTNDIVTLTINTGTVTGAMSGTGSFSGTVIEFAAAGEVATITSTAAADGMWAQTVAATVVTPGSGAYTMADIGDTFVITAVAATDVATLTLTSGTVSYAMSGTGTVTGNVISFAAIGETATVTCLTAGVGTWAQTTGSPTAAAPASGPTVTAAGTGASDYFTITFPTDTRVNATTVAGSIVTGPGWVDGVWAPLPECDEIKFVGVDATTYSKAYIKVIIGGLGATVNDRDIIGEGAEVRITITTGITNPSTIAGYTLTVKSNVTGDTTEVTSTTYSIGAPTVGALPGIVRLYNPSGIEMMSYSSTTGISQALAYPAGEGFKITVGPGTYSDSPNTNAAKLTIEATGTAAETIVVGAWTIDQPETTISGFTIRNAAGAVSPTIDIKAAADKVVIQNCIIGKSGSAPYYYNAQAEELINFDAVVSYAPPYGYAYITGCTFDTTLRSVLAPTTPIYDTAIDVNSWGLTISNNTFAVDSGDTAIDVAGGFLYFPTAISTDTITGSSGTGVQVTAGRAEISGGTTFSNLATALEIGGGTTTVKDSTITGCGQVAITAYYIPAAPAINVASVGATAPTLTITNSVITAGVDEILEVDATANTDDASLVALMFNDLSGNAKGIDNNDANTANIVNATVNWWGDAAGPALYFNSGVNATGYTGSTTTGSVTTISNKLTASTTVGVDVEVTLTTGAAWVPGTGSIIGAASYPANPQDATPEPALEGGFYDVYFVDTSTTAAASVLVKFYNTNITADTVAMVWSDLQGFWVNVSDLTPLGVPVTNQGINAFGGFIWIRLDGNSTPNILDLSGTPFALVEPAAVTAVAPVAPAILMPAFGEQEAPIKPTFTWTAPATATSYEFVLAEEIGQDDKFAIIDYSATTDINGHVAREQLKFDTVYNWRVRAVNAVGAGAWTTGFFTTVAEPEPEPEPIPSVIVKEMPPTPAPEIILNVPPATKQEVQVIPDYLLWVVVAVGAVLIIAVVVLIVRTRRVT